MNEQTGFFTRVGEWFKRGSSQPNGDLPLEGQIHEPGSQGESPIVVRSTFLRPWAKRDAAIENLQNGVAAMGDLMNSIRDNLQRSNERQDQLLQYLSHLPQALEQLPESSRVQSETLKAIHQRMAQQSEEQTKLASILERISQTDTANGRTLHALQERFETLTEHDGKIAENLNTVGAALQSVSKNSEATSSVLRSMHEGQAARDGEVERILQKQGNRFTLMLSIAIFIAMAALAAVGFLLLNGPVR